jgi:LytS/YehU family sensor histidine kinase
VVGLAVAFVPAFVYHQIMLRFPADHILIGLLRLTVVVVLAFGVHRLARRVPLPARGTRLRFVLIHIIAAASAIAITFTISGWLNQVIFGEPTDGRLGEISLIGTYLYIVVAGVSYAVEEKARAMRAEAAAARMQLGALRGQLQPHFLFNALHAVIQLIPIDPKGATEAAELVADLLRTTMEEERDLVLLDEEWRFVSRYIDLERIRFGDRLRVRSDIDPDLLDVQVPSFALQTLVENAIRHGAAPRIDPTDIVVAATATERDVTLSVRNTDDGATRNRDGSGTGLKRLHERLVALYGNRAQLSYGARADGVYESVLVLPRQPAIA